MIEIETKNIEDLLIRLGPNGLKKAEKVALREAANKIKDVAVSNLKTRLPKATEKGDKYDDTLADAVMMSVKEGAVNTMYFTVHTMGTRRGNSGTFRARFFQQGTVPRKANKKYNRGRIAPLHFFSDAVATASNGAINGMKSTFTIEINKLINND